MLDLKPINDLHKAIQLQLKPWPVDPNAPVLLFRIKKVQYMKHLSIDQLIILCTSPDIELVAQAKEELKKRLLVLDSPMEFININTSRIPDRTTVKSVVWQVEKHNLKPLKNLYAYIRSKIRK